MIYMIIKTTNKQFRLVLQLNRAKIPNRKTDNFGNRIPGNLSPTFMSNYSIPFMKIYLPQTYPVYINSNFGIQPTKYMIITVTKFELF